MSGNRMEIVVEHGSGRVAVKYFDEHGYLGQIFFWYADGVKRVEDTWLQVFRTEHGKPEQIGNIFVHCPYEIKESWGDDGQ